MTRTIAALICILSGIWLIAVSLRRPRKYITLSGHYQGRTWARRIPA